MTGLVDGGHDPVLVIVSPPRCGSTALARSFWRHDRFRWYCHEPFDLVYHAGAGLDSVRTALAKSLDDDSPGGTGLVVKEMTFQARGHLPDLMGLATLPLVFLLRDPRRAILSRARQRDRAGDEPWFPHRESGWHDLLGALATAREHAVPHVVVDFDLLRGDPGSVLPALCRAVGVEFTPRMLSWPSRGDLDLGQLGGAQRHWYEQVLTSTGFEPELRPPPSSEEFPARDGMRAHVAECVDLYRDFLRLPEALAPDRRP
ncbi:hypothetical protein [Umezawaea sp. NPDC059074]|uniref:sulfotransferase-like domain-containing protein n=1 Tax=Umezawaea sp. NPDC059074 TaxID=3346716 RepID=UPI0036832B03